MTKEFKVYTCPITEPYFQFTNKLNTGKKAEDYLCGAALIEHWSSLDTLPLEALNFMVLCVEHGSVYTLPAFQYAVNRDYVDFTNSYIFITNKY
jgi:hypothetical protein